MDSLKSPKSENSPDRQWYEEQFIKTVQTRGAAVISARKLSSALSAAKAISDHLTIWLNGSEWWCSMAVCSQGEYDTPAGLFYSMPVTCKDGNWSIVKNLNIDEFSRAMIDKSAAELIEERDEALQFLSNS